MRTETLERDLLLLGIDLCHRRPVPPPLAAGEEVAWEERVPLGGGMMIVDVDRYAGPSESGGQLPETGRAPVVDDDQTSIRGLRQVVAIPHYWMFVWSNLYLRTRVEGTRSPTAHFKRGFSFFDGLLSALMWRSVHSVEYSPDKAAELPGNGGDSDMTVLALVKAPELLVEAMLGFKGDGDNGRGLSLPATVQDQFRPGAVVIVPGRLDQEATSMDVPGLGDMATVFLLTR